jgi:hypothetical protein
VILNKKIEACVVNPVIADVPYSVSSVCVKRDYEESEGEEEPQEREGGDIDLI